MSITAAALLIVIAAGAACAVVLIAATVARQLVRNRIDRYRAHQDQAVRPEILGVVASRQVPDSAVRARGRQGRAVERVTYQYLSQIRGEIHSLLVELLARRGTVARALRDAYAWRVHNRTRAAELLGIIASPQAEECLADLAKHDPSQRVRVVAIRALGESGTTSAATALLDALGPANPTLVPEGVVGSALLSLGTAALPVLRAEAATGTPVRRATAVDLLGLLKDLPAWQTVARNLHDPQPRVRLSAVRALGQLGLRQGVEPLIGILDGDEEPGIRAAAAWALGRIRDARAVPVLSGCQDDPDYQIAHNAAQALTWLREPGGQALGAAASGDGAAAMHAREALAAGPQPPGLRPPASLPPVLSRPEYLRGRGLAWRTG